MEQVTIDLTEIKRQLREARTAEDIQAIIKERPHFCTHPWRTSYLDTGGNRKICCASHVRYDHKEEGTTVWNSSWMKRIRLNMLKGIPNPECVVCSDYEKVNGAQHSYRITTLTRLAEVPSFKRGEMMARFIDNTEDDGTLNIPASMWDIRTPQCNLKCQMCSPASSTSLLSQHKQMYGKQHWFAKQMSEYDLRNSLDDLFEGIEAGQVNRVLIAGGEPLMGGVLFEVVDYIKEAQHTGKKLPIIALATNATMLEYNGRHISELLDTNAQVEIFLSIDGIGKVIEYQRDGTIWSEVEPNLKWYFEQTRLRKARGIETRGFIHTVFTLPVLMHMEELVSWLNEYAYDYRWTPLEYRRMGLDNLVLGHMMDIRNLPQVYSDQILSDAYDACVKSILPFSHESYAVIEGYREFNRTRGGESRLSDWENQAAVVDWKEGFLQSGVHINELMSNYPQLRDWWNALSRDKDAVRYFVDGVNNYHTNVAGSDLMV